MYSSRGSAASAMRARLLPGVDDLVQRLGQGLRDVPARVMAAHLAEIGVIADVIAGAILIDVGVDLRLAGHAFGHRERFQDRARILLAAPEVVDLAAARRRREGGN